MTSPLSSRVSCIVAPLCTYKEHTMRYIGRQYLEGVPLTVHTREQILPGMVKVQLWGWRCERCGHEWLPREEGVAPRVCPKCKSPYWDRPRQNPAAKKKARKA